MTTVHRTLTGAWGKCFRPSTCDALFHLPDTTVKQAKQLPAMMLEDLLEAVEPPMMITSGAKTWLDEAGQIHRDYDLPALITAEGSRCWFQHGVNHRVSDRPSVVLADGSQEWHASGHLHRAGGKPAVIAADGRQEWWSRGALHRSNGPARVHPNGFEEFWMHGIQMGATF